MKLEIHFSCEKNNVFLHDDDASHGLIVEHSRP